MVVCRNRVVRRSGASFDEFVAYASKYHDGDIQHEAQGEAQSVQFLIIEGFVRQVLIDALQIFLRKGLEE